MLCKKHNYLCYTNLLLILSIVYFVYGAFKTTRPFIEYILTMFLITVIITSQCFWKNPIQHSNIHKIDAILAKLVIASFVLYTLLYKFKFSYLIILFAVVTCAYLSNYYSSFEWCSHEHILWHGLLHVCCFLATFYAFIW